MAHNAWGLYEGGELNHKTMLEAQKFIQPQMFIRSTKPPLLYSPCYTLFVLIFLCVGNH